MTTRAVFVCSGNICRSPMAAGMAKHLIEARGESAAIISCGTLNINGRPAASNAIAAMKEIEMDISSHYSQGAVVGLLKMADHIVIMAPQHERALLDADATLKPKIRRMWEYSSDDLSQIDDPVGKDLDAFRACRDLLLDCVQDWLDEVFGEVSSQ